MNGTVSPSSEDERVYIRTKTGGSFYELKIRSKELAGGIKTDRLNGISKSNGVSIGSSTQQIEKQKPRKYSKNYSLVDDNVDVIVIHHFWKERESNALPFSTLP